MEKYIPKPLDTSKIQLSDQLLSLAEALAKNTHEVWAQGKMAEGYVYGPTVDDVAKTHPSLVGYEELSESQKDYDRRTSQQAIKYLLACGFTIEKK